jgi:hypothetical protein
MNARAVARQRDNFHKVMLGILTGNAILIALFSYRWGWGSISQKAPHASMRQSSVNVTHGAAYAAGNTRRAPTAATTCFQS